MDTPPINASSEQEVFDYDSDILEFQKDIVHQLLNEPVGLWVIGAGLGLGQIVQAYISNLERMQAKCTQKLLYLFLCVDSVPAVLARHLSDYSTGKYKLVNGQYTKKCREVIWNEGGIYFVTSRILVVDMLKKRIPYDRLGGIILVMVKNFFVSDSSTESFILRLYVLSHARLSRRGGKSRYPPLTIKAITDQVEHFSTGFSRLSKVVDALYVGAKVFLWSRFRKAVKTSLERGPNVVHIYPHMSLIQGRVHQALVRMIEACLKELKNVVPKKLCAKEDLESDGLNSVDFDEWTLENCLFKSFHRRMRAQLEVASLRITRKARQLIRDIDKLRWILQCLIKYDAVTFYQLLLNERKRELTENLDSPPIWLMMDEVDHIFDLSRSRLYTTPEDRKDEEDDHKRRRLIDRYSDSPLSQKSSSSDSPRKQSIRLVCEENSKWKAVVAVLNEIRKVCKSFPKLSAAPVLLLVRDESVQSTLSDYISLSDGSIYLLKKLKDYLVDRRDHYNRIRMTQQMAEAKNSLNEEAGNVSELLRLIEMQKGFQKLSNRKELFEEGDNEEDVLAEEPVELENEFNEYFGLIDVVDEPKDTGCAPTDTGLSGEKQEVIWIQEEGPSNERTTEGMCGDSEKANDSDNTDNNSANNDNSIDGNNNTNGDSSTDGNNNTNSGNGSVDNNDTNNYKIDGNNTDAYVTIQNDEDGAVMAVDGVTADNAGGFSDVRKDGAVDCNGAEPCVMICVEEEALSLMKDFKVHFIILYDLELSHVRQVECYKAGCPGRFVRVYFLMYKGSVEEKMYLSVVRKEREAFEKLIQEKSRLEVRSEEVKGEESGESEVEEGGALVGKVLRYFGEKGVNTRRGGRGEENGKKKRSKVVVDIREFRSKLPGILHAHRIELIPKTLVIADYVLTPDIAVERKSIPDLRQSLMSGRLYNQLEQLVRLYRHPILLIEFDQSEAFELQKVDELTPSIRGLSISSKLVLLTMHFRSLRIVWSRSPYETARVFLSLKEEREEPEVRKGALGEGDESDAWVRESLERFEGFDVLSRIPGIDEKNMKDLLFVEGKKVPCLAEMARWSRRKFVEILGSEAGNRVYEFLNYTPSIYKEAKDQQERTFSAESEKGKGAA